MTPGNAPEAYHEAEVARNRSGVRMGQEDEVDGKGEDELNAEGSREIGYDVEDAEGSDGAGGVGVNMMELEDLMAVEVAAGREVDVVAIEPGGCDAPNEEEGRDGRCEDRMVMRSVSAMMRLEAEGLDLYNCATALRATEGDASTSVANKSRCHHTTPDVAFPQTQFLPS